MRIDILNGPNLNLLGTREPEIYGSMTLAEIAEMVKEHAGESHQIIFEQTNSEGTLVDLIQRAGREADGLILNAASYTHTSIAVHDALKAVAVPKVEVHLSNPLAREEFRHHSYVSAVVNVVIAGAGPEGYRLAVTALINMTGG